MRRDDPAARTPPDVAGLRHGLSVSAFLSLFTLFAFLLYRGGALAALGERIGSPLERYFLGAGVYVQKIVVRGQVRLGDEAILAALGIRTGQSLFGFDAAQAQQRLAALELVRSARVMRLLPATLVIDIEERSPFARWQRNSETVLIDREGVVLTQAEPIEGSRLPLVAGDGAARQAETLIRLLMTHEQLAELVAMARLVDGSRWDLVGRAGAVVKLPPADTALALARFVRMEEWRELLQSADSVVDLRLADRAFLRRVKQKPQVPAEAG